MKHTIAPNSIVQGIITDQISDVLRSILKVSNPHSIAAIQNVVVNTINAISIVICYDISCFNSSSRCLSSITAILRIVFWSFGLRKYGLFQFFLRTHFPTGTSTYFSFILIMFLTMIQTKGQAPRREPGQTTYMEATVRIRLHKSYMSGLLSHHSPHFSTKAFSDGYSRLRTRLPSTQYHMYHTLSFFGAVLLVSFITIYFKGLNNRFLSITEFQVACRVN